MDDSNTQFVADWLSESLTATRDFATDSAASATLVAMSEVVAAALRQNAKLLIVGNGGSAADAQHIAAEFVSRMNYDRSPLAALALTTDTSALTAIGNDYGFAHAFERQVQAFGRPGDVLLAISTSGRSPNVVLALLAARKLGMATLGFTGSQGSPMAEHCDLLLRAPSPTTPIIQQIHIIAGHVLCSLVERMLCPRPLSPRE